MSELNWKITEKEAGIEVEVSTYDCLSQFMCSWNDYTQGLRNNGPSRLYKYITPKPIYSAFIAAQEMLSGPIKKKQRDRMLLAVAQMKTAIENFRHLREMGIAPDPYSLPYWKYLSQYTHKAIVKFLEDFGKDNDLDLLPKGLTV